MYRKKGFTLIELLVVIAIIAMLLGVILPSIQKAKAIAQRAVCLSNQRQFGLSGNIYSNDNEGKFPYTHMVYPGSQGYNNGKGNQGWGSYALFALSLYNSAKSGSGPSWLRSTGGYFGHGLFYHWGYTEDPEIYYCPANRDPTLKYGEPSPIAGDKGGGIPKGKVPDGLGPNQELIQATYHYRSMWDGHEWRSLNSVKDGSGVGLMADVFSDPNRGKKYHHKNGYNITYGDGHGAFIKDTKQETEAIEWLNNGTRWNSRYDMQDYVWKEFFDEITKYDRKWHP